MTLNIDQQKALDELLEFVTGSSEQVHILRGQAGTGKTFLIKELLLKLEQQFQLLKSLGSPYIHWKPILTATTHKAAEALSNATNSPVTTVHSHFDLIVRNDFKNNTTSLTRRKNAHTHHEELIIVDESSYIDEDLREYIIDGSKTCKVIFMGDHAQLTPVGCNYSPVFDADYPESTLTIIERQENPDLKDACEAFRAHVLGAKFPDVDLVPGIIEQLSGDDFKALMLTEFQRPDWNYYDSKYIAWTNQVVIGCNNFVRSNMHGSHEFRVGDYAINNKSISNNSSQLKPDQTVLISDIYPDSHEYGVLGNQVMLDGKHSFFLPKDVSQIKTMIEKYTKEGDIYKARAITETWVDLRAAYACTVNKSQGSTFDTVFLDLGNINLCRDKDLKARLLYVAFSRARKKVIITGNF